MRFLDLLYLSTKAIQRTRILFLAIPIIISTFCLCIAGTAFKTMEQEKSMPFELLVSSTHSTGVSDGLLADVLNIPDVTNATSLLSIPVQAEMGGYRAALVLTGISPSYLEAPHVFPEHTVMPYLLMNEAACKVFQKEGKTTTTTEIPPIDWLHTKVILKIEEESIGTTAKISGLLENAMEEDAVAYISYHAAELLLRSNEQPIISNQAYVRIKNIGCAERVSRALLLLGLTTVDPDEVLQSKWKMWTIEMSFLVAIGILSLLAYIAFLLLYRHIHVAERERTNETLQLLGMKKTTISHMYLLQMVWIVLLGIGIGTCATMVLPSFLPQELKSTSMFMLPISMIVISINACLHLGITILVFCESNETCLKLNQYHQFSGGIDSML